jgi:hypothetical protein
MREMLFKSLTEAGSAEDLTAERITSTSNTSPAALSEAVNKLDGVFGELRYQDVTAPQIPLLSAAVSN